MTTLTGEDPADPSAHEPEDDPIYPAAVRVCTAKRGRITHATLQCAMFIGFNRADRLLEALEARGVLTCVPTERGGHWRLAANAADR